MTPQEAAEKKYPFFIVNEMLSLPVNEAQKLLSIAWIAGYTAREQKGGWMSRN